jgi:hypothetical protein
MNSLCLGIATHMTLGYSHCLGIATHITLGYSHCLGIATHMTLGYSHSLGYSTACHSHDRIHNALLLLIIYKHTPTTV